MSLPALTLPAGLPMWRASGYQAAPESLYAVVPMAVGAARRRRVYTVADRLETVTLRLTDAQLQAFHEWFEDDLQAGLQPFAAPVPALGGGVIEWYDALLLDYATTPGAAGRTVLQATLRLRGEAYGEGPSI